MKNLLKESKEIKNEVDFPLFEANDNEETPILDLSLREIYQLREHKDLDKYIEKVQNLVREAQERNDELLLDEVQDLLEKIENPKLYSMKDLDFQNIKKIISEMDFEEGIDTLKDSANNELTELFDNVDEETEDYIKTMIDKHLEERVYSALNSDYHQIQDELLEATKRFIEETEPSFFIKEEVIQSLLETPLFKDDEEDVRDYLRTKVHPGSDEEVRKKSWNPNKTYYKKISEAIEALRPAVEPKIDESMSISQINEELKSNPSEFLFSQIESFLKTKELREKRQREMAESVSLNEKEEAEVKEQKLPKEHRDKDLFEWYSKILKAIDTFENKIYEDIGVSKDYDKEVLGNRINKTLEELVKEPLRDMKKIDETFPIEDYLPPEPQSILGAYIKIKEAQSKDEYKNRKSVIEKELKKRDKNGSETVFKNRDDLELVEIGGYSYLLKPKKDLIEYEIVFDLEKRKKELGL